jgi:hypothetical protein
VLVVLEVVVDHQLRVLAAMAVAAISLRAAVAEGQVVTEEQLALLRIH